MEGEEGGEMERWRKALGQEGPGVCISKGTVRRQRRAADSGSEGSRDERKSREEGCGGVVFTGH